MDPGAVPGASTMKRFLWGRHRIDTRGKGGLFVRYGSVVIGLTIISVAILRTRKEKKIANRNFNVANSNREVFEVAAAAA